jgi:hypothetical protein
MVVQAPVPKEHDVHAPLQLANEQQKPSLHTPVVHWASVEHAPPGAV